MAAVIVSLRLVGGVGLALVTALGFASPASASTAMPGAGTYCDIHSPSYQCGGVWPGGVVPALPDAGPGQEWEWLFCNPPAPGDGSNMTCPVDMWLGDPGSRSVPAGQIFVRLSYPADQPAPAPIGLEAFASAPAPASPATAILMGATGDIQGSLLNVGISVIGVGAVVLAMVKAWSFFKSLLRDGSPYTGKNYSLQENSGDDNE